MKQLIKSLLAIIDTCCLQVHCIEANNKQRNILLCFYFFLYDLSLTFYYYKIFFIYRQLDLFTNWVIYYFKKMINIENNNYSIWINYIRSKTLLINILQKEKLKFYSLYFANFSFSFIIYFFDFLLKIAF